MDITQDFADANFIITGYKPGCVFINNEPHEKSIIVNPETLISPWDVTDISGLNETTLEAIFKDPPEIVILGTGEFLVLPEPKIIALFAQHRIGLEFMNTSAACRTYGILIAEGRKATAAIINSL
jgi:uncharacterized protein